MLEACHRCQAWISASNKQEVQLTDLDRIVELGSECLASFLKVRARTNDWPESDVDAEVSTPGSINTNGEWECSQRNGSMHERCSKSGFKQHNARTDAFMTYLHGPPHNSCTSWFESLNKEEHTMYFSQTNGHQETLAAQMASRKPSMDAALALRCRRRAQQEAAQTSEPVAGVEPRPALPTYIPRHQIAKPKHEVSVSFDGGAARQYHVAVNRHRLGQVELQIGQQPHLHWGGLKRSAGIGIRTGNQAQAMTGKWAAVGGWHAPETLRPDSVPETGNWYTQVGSGMAGRARRVWHIHLTDWTGRFEMWMQQGNTGPLMKVAKMVENDNLTHLSFDLSPLQLKGLGLVDEHEELGLESEGARPWTNEVELHAAAAAVNLPMAIEHLSPHLPNLLFERACERARGRLSRMACEVDVHTSAISPTGRLECNDNYYLTGRCKESLAVRRLVGEAMHEYVQVKQIFTWGNWSGDAAGFSEDLALIQPLVPAEVESDFVGKGSASLQLLVARGAEELCAITDLRALTTYGSPVLEVSGFAAVIAPWVGTHGHLDEIADLDLSPEQTEEAEDGG